MPKYGTCVQNKLEIVKEDISFPSSYEAAMKYPEPPPWYTRVSINLDIYIFAGKPKHSLAKHYVHDRNNNLSTLWLDSLYNLAYCK